MLIDTTLGAAETAGPAAATAEADGYDGAFTGEVNSDPFLPLALAATATEHIELGTSIAVAFARSPMTLAYTAWDLQRLSQGRLSIGLGSQVKAHINRRFSMPWGKPVAQLREFVTAMRAAWQSWSTGEPMQHNGEYYQHTLMPPTFVPPNHNFGMPKVLLAGVGDAMTSMAGEVADGFLCHGFTTQRWIEERTMPALVEGRRRAGATLDGFTIKAATYLATGTDEQIASAINEIRGHISFYASTPAYQSLMELHGWSDIGAELTVMSKTGRWAEMPGLISDAMVEAFAIVGPEADVPAKLEKRFGGHLDRVSFLTQAPSAALREALRG